MCRVSEADELRPTLQVCRRSLSLLYQLSVCHVVTSRLSCIQYAVCASCRRVASQSSLYSMPSVRRVVASPSSLYSTPSVRRVVASRLSRRYTVRRLCVVSSRRVSVVVIPLVVVYLKVSFGSAEVYWLHRGPSYHQLSYHLYADDTQLLGSTSTSNIRSTVDRLQSCVAAIHQ